jgi:membrane-bound lytic murein transglycosylase C
MALDEINDMLAPVLYDRLRTSLPYEETRNYLAKVVSYRKQFVAMTTSSWKT